MTDQTARTTPKAFALLRTRRISVQAPLRRVGSRFAVILSGELVQSLFHFMLNIVLVRELGARDYGLFAIVFTVGAVGVTYIRALVAVPATCTLPAAAAARLPAATT
jgi:hypothetical protein